MIVRWIPNAYYIIFLYTTSVFHDIFNIVVHTRFRQTQSQMQNFGLKTKKIVSSFSFFCFLLISTTFNILQPKKVTNSISISRWKMQFRTGSILAYPIPPSVWNFQWLHETLKSRKNNLIDEEFPSCPTFSFYYIIWRSWHASNFLITTDANSGK